jgi:hypothetical protein
MMRNHQEAYLMWREHLEEVSLMSKLTTQEAQSFVNLLAEFYKTVASQSDKLDSLKRHEYKKEAIIAKLLELPETAIMTLTSLAHDKVKRKEDIDGDEE